MEGNEMTVKYPVLFTQTNDDNDTYLVEIPDMKGYTEGHGICDAVNMAKDYIGGYLYKMEDSEFPVPSDIDDLKISKSAFSVAGRTFAAIVDMDIDMYRKKQNNRSVRKNVSLPYWLNEAAEKAHINVSRVLQDALIEKLNIML